MNGIKSLFQTVLSTENTYLDVYLDGLIEHKIFDPNSGEDIEMLVQRINLLLMQSNTRTLGLQLLNEFLDYPQTAILERKANVWIPVILKSCNSPESSDSVILFFEILRKFAMKCQENPDLSKMFVTSYLGKVYESVNNVLEIGAESALRCIETCLILYAAPSASFKGLIDKFLKKFIDATDDNVIIYCGKCMHLLQQIRGGGQGGINHKTRWQEYQNQLIASIHTIFNEMFSNCSETYESDNYQETGRDMARIDLSNEPVKKVAQLYVRVHNVIQYLIIALKDPFPVEKSIMPKKILNLISRGTRVTCINLQQNPIADNLALGILLPKLHKDLLFTLDTLILTLGSHLKPHYQLIWDIALDSLKWTKVLSAQEDSNGTTLGTLRAKAYETIALWCQTLKSGCCGEMFTEFLIKEIFSDTPCMVNGLTLKVLSGARKHLSKKARRQLHKANNNQSKLTQTNSNLKTQQNENKNLLTSVWALRCLQQLLWALANFLKPPTLKIIHLNTIQLCTQLYNDLPIPSQIQRSSMYRLEVYNTLNAIIMAPNHLCPPPTEIALKILQYAHLNDNSISVRNNCSHLMRNLEKLIHPQKEGLLFPLEARDIRNAFIKLGQEHLLDSANGNLSGMVEYNENDDNNDISDNGENEIVVDKVKENEAAQPIEELDNSNTINGNRHLSSKDFEITRDHQNNSSLSALEKESNNEVTLASELEVEEELDDKDSYVHRNNYSLSALEKESNNEVTLARELAVEEELDDKDSYVPNLKKRKIVEAVKDDSSQDHLLPTVNANDAEAIDQLLEDIAAEFVDELN
uniref:Pre-rRNA-processing protein RIX1 N-terminal domain-containing protein n=1 Tax=Glossina brevipalpis TaxID=37001 RepID=A0A1A9W861_9MUSC